MENSINYLNNYSYDKIYWDSYIEPYKTISTNQATDTIFYSLDTV